MTLRVDRGTPRNCDATLKKVIEGNYLKNPTLSVSSIFKLIKEYCIEKNIKTPSYRSICRIISNIPDDIALLNKSGSKAYRQRYDLLHIRAAEQPNELWQADHLLIDFDIVNDKNQLQKPWLTVVIDDCSRSICGYELSFLSPSALKTSLCFRHAIWRKSDPTWEVSGIPAAFYTDHGSDFTSKHIEQVCVDLKTKLIFSAIGQPRGRGKIERFFRTLNQTLIQKIKAITKNKKYNQLNLKDLDSIVYDFIVHYNNSYHSEIKMSPLNRWKSSGFLPRIPESLEYLDLLLLTEAKTRKILREGIKFQGLRYIDTVLAEYVGEEVVIRYNPSDITSIRVFYKGGFLCQPLCAELSTLKVGIKDIQRARNQRRLKLKKEINERVSLVDAVIAASEIPFPSSTENEEPLQNAEIKSNKLRLYENE